MKTLQKEKARELRKEGYSINEIYKKLGVSKGTVSLWVRDIELTDSQKANLSQRGHSIDVVEKRRKVRLENEKNKRQQVINEAKKDITYISKKELFLMGIMLYWAEGRKTARGMADISNGDPRIIQVALRFFREICGVPEEKLRAHIHIHPHLSVKRAEQYWSTITGIPHAQFIKTYSKPNKGSNNKRDTLPYGTVSVYVCDTQLSLRIKGWIEGAAESLLSKNQIGSNADNDKTLPLLPFK